MESVATGVSNFARRRKFELFLKYQGVDFEKPYCLDLQFTPRSVAANKEGFTAALEAANFKVFFYKNDPTVEVSVQGILLTPETILIHERNNLDP
jgi:hypothetical protein